MPCSAAYAAHPRGPRLPHQRRARRGSRCRRRGRRRPARRPRCGRTAARSGRVSGRIAPVISTVRWPAARCSRIRRTASGESRDSTWSVRCSSAIASRSASRAPVVLAVDRAQEVAALAPLGLHQARAPCARDPAELGEPLGAVELAQPHPQVGLDHVGRQQRAVHVEERGDARCSPADAASARLARRPLARGAGARRGGGSAR